MTLNQWTHPILIVFASVLSSVTAAKNAAFVDLMPSASGISGELNIAQIRLIAHYDANYDPGQQLLRWTIRGRKYHTTLRAGMSVHPTRESLAYALALLQRGNPGDSDRAAKIIRRVLSLQETNPDHPAVGVWPYFAEEALDEMDPPDLNWADFCGAQLAHMLVKYADLLPSELKEKMAHSLRLAAQAIQHRDVGPGYTNIAILGAGVCCVAGEILDNELLNYGRSRLLSVVEHTNLNGGFSEYNSPNYGMVVVAECERILELVQDAEARDATELLRRAAWQMIAESFHPQTQQWAGPHSRSYSLRLEGGVADFIARRVGVPITPHSSQSIDSPTLFATVSPIPCPPEIASHFRREISVPYEIHRTFCRSLDPNRALVGTTWFSNDACLGSVSRSSFWNQRKPMIAYWKSEEDSAVVFRVRFLRDGEDFASMGIRTVQKQQRALCSVESLQGRGGWHRTLDRPDTGIFEASDLRLRFELLGRGANAKQLSESSWALIAGNNQVAIHTPPSESVLKSVQWELGGHDSNVFLDGICYRGERRGFDFSKPLAIRLGAGIELLPANESPSERMPRFEESATQEKIVWHAATNSTLSMPVESFVAVPLSELAMSTIQLDRHK